MNQNTELVAVDSSAVQSPSTSSSQFVSAIPAPPEKLSAKDKKFWDYITAALLEYGLIHKTDGFVLLIIVKTFQRWVQTETLLEAHMKENNGNYFVKTPNGYDQPHQLYFAARNLKGELLKWLPEAALTIPSFHKIVGDQAAPLQGGLFDDPVEAHQKRGRLLKFPGANPAK